MKAIKQGLLQLLQQPLFCQREAWKTSETAGKSGAENTPADSLKFQKRNKRFGRRIHRTVAPRYFVNTLVLENLTSL